MLHFRPATEDDYDGVWEIFHPVVSTGDTYTFDPATPRADALAYWFQKGNKPYVATTEDGKVVGTYLLRPNQPALGAHVANAAFMVSPTARGMGVGRQMGEHCLTSLAGWLVLGILIAIVCHSVSLYRQRGVPA